jgi:tetratricopeptide (TPR) repeat protein
MSLSNYSPPLGEMAEGQRGSVANLIEQGEFAREKGQDERALSLLDRAIFEAGKKKDYASLLAALSHKLLVWKHAYLKAKDMAFLELMFSEAWGGLKIAQRVKVEKGFQAVFLLRIGHYFQYKGNYKLAQNYGRKALKFISKNDKARYAEYLGHFGLSQALAGNKQGLNTLKQALKLIEKAKKVRPFHKLVIHSGILTRASIALNKFGKKSEAREMLDAAFELAKILARQYKMPMRLHEALEIKKKKLKVF